MMVMASGGWQYDGCSPIVVHGDVTAERPQFGELAAGAELGRVAAIEPVGAEVDKRCARLREDVPDRDKHRVADGFARAHLAPAGRETVVLGGQIGALGPSGGHGSDGEMALQPTVSLAGRALLGLSSRFVLSGAHPSPRRQVARRGKAGHVDTDLADDRLGNATVDARDSAQPLPGVSERCYVGGLPSVSRSSIGYDGRALERLSSPNGLGARGGPHGYRRCV